MRIAYLDCSNGVSGDMLLAALLDAGLGIKELKGELAKLPLNGYSCQLKKTRSGALVTSRLIVKTTKPQHFRNLREITQIINQSQLDLDIKKKSKIAFKKLAMCEANVHGFKINEVHFHEIGAVDTIIDIVGVFWAIKKLKIDKVFCSPVNVGSGKVKTLHGILPVPAPATVELLKDIPIYNTEVKQELTTPTGSLLVSLLGKKFGTMGKIKVRVIGNSSGSKDYPGHVNLFRVFIGESH